MVENERLRDAAIEEIAALNGAEALEVGGAGERRARLLTADDDRRKLREQLERLEVDLRKLRTQYKVGVQRGREGGGGWGVLICCLP